MQYMVIALYILFVLIIQSSSNHYILEVCFSLIDIFLTYLLYNLVLKVELLLMKIKFQWGHFKFFVINEGTNIYLRTSNRNRLIWDVHIFDKIISLNHHLLSQNFVWWHCRIGYKIWTFQFSKTTYFYT